MADIIDELKGLDDKALAAKLGFEERISSFKDDLAKAAKLSGDPRDKVVRRLTEMFTPDTYAVDSLKRVVQNASSPKGPSQIAGCGCGMPGDYD